MTSPVHILLVEPQNVASLYPFSVLHCSWELRCGALRLFEVVERMFPHSPLGFAGRDLHLRSFLARHDRTNRLPAPGAGVVVLTETILPTDDMSARIAHAMTTGVPAVFTAQGRRIGAFLPSLPGNVDPARGLPEELLAGAAEVHTDAPVLSRLWDAIAHNAQAITQQARLFPHTGFTLPDGIFCIAPDRIHIGANVSLGPCTVLDASAGPIVLGDRVRIMPQTTILGPCAIGSNSVIKVGAKIYGETSIGEWCKVGGEVENSIIHAYSNKQHDGFLGHSYLGEWVNLGADTNTSDLKNNYGRIRVRLRSEDVDTERMFLGLLCGDHSKSGINTMFNTGTVVGVSANIFGGDFPPKSIPSFSWGGGATPRFDIDKAVELARTVMARRARTLLPEEEELLRREFAATAGV